MILLLFDDKCARINNIRPDANSIAHEIIPNSARAFNNWHIDYLID